MIDVITIARKLGSLGRLAAEEAAQRLGYRIVERELIDQAARRAGAPEAALATIDELHLLGVSVSPEANRAYLEAVRQVILELAAVGNVVILGRGGQAILRGHTSVLHVRITAPLDLRVERISQRHRIPLEAARAMVNASDRERKRYLKRCYGIQWDDPELYDLVINTAHVTQQTAVELICRAVQTLPPAEPGASL